MRIYTPLDKTSESKMLTLEELTPRGTIYIDRPEDWEDNYEMDHTLTCPG